MVDIEGGGGDGWLLVQLVFVVHRGLIAECAVAPHAVVEGFDIVQDRQPCLMPCGEAAAADESGLERAPEAFQVGVVLPVGAAAHARGDAVQFQHPAVVLAGVLHAAVAVMEQARGQFASRDGLPQRGFGQAGLQMSGRGRADDAAAAKVEHAGDVEPAFLGPDIM